MPGWPSGDLDGIHGLYGAAKAFGKKLNAARFTNQSNILHRIIKRIDVARTALTITLRKRAFLTLLYIPRSCHEKILNGDPATIRLPVQIKRRGVESRLIIDGETRTTHPDPLLIQTMARSHVWCAQLVTGKVISVRNIAHRENLDAGDISRTLPLAFLAPDIVKAIPEGRQPVELTADALKRQSATLPLGRAIKASAVLRAKPARPSYDSNDMK